MKNRKYIILALILLICILSISVASATSDISADNSQKIILDEGIGEDLSANNQYEGLSAHNLKENVNEDISIDYTDENLQENNLSLSNCKEDVVLEDKDESNSKKLQLRDSSTKNFTELNTLINGNEDTVIELKDNYAYTDDNGFFTGGIKISRSLTINGNNHTIDGMHAARIFDVTADNVTIKNITFINGNYVTKGGAVYWGGRNGTIEYCTFMNNSANYSGALEWQGRDGKVLYSTFENNNATIGGGAIYWDALRGLVANCTFNNNHIPRKYIYYDPDNPGEIAIDGTGDIGGGAIHWSGEKGVVANCTFENGLAGEGGAIKWFGEDGVLANSTMRYNQAHLGGAVHWTGKNGLIINDTFINNTATETVIEDDEDDGEEGDGEDTEKVKKGSAIRLYLTTVDIESCIIYNPDTDGIFWFGDTSGTISNSILYTGVCFYNSNGATIENNWWFGANASNYTVSPHDGAETWLYLNGTADPERIHISDTSDVRFYLSRYNSTSGQPSDYDNSLIPSFNFTLSSSKGNIKDSAVLEEDLTYTAEKSGIDNISAESDYGSYAISLRITPGGSFWDLNQTINNNTDSEIILDRNYTYDPEFDEPFIYGVTIDRKLNIDGAGHTIDGIGTARIFTITGNNVTLQNISFVNGHAEGSTAFETCGGAIYWDGANGATHNCTFINNTAEHGGAIYGILCENHTLSDCTFIENNCNDGHGGAIKFFGDNAKIYNSNFTNNKAKILGGAVELNGENSTVSNCTFINNTAVGGGALKIQADNSVVSDCTFIDNSAIDGGAIRWQYSDNATIANSTFINNTAEKGSAIDSIDYERNKFNVYGSYFSKNNGDSLIHCYNYDYFNSQVHDNIILNNSINSYISYDVDESNPGTFNISADNNWFGNNATNADAQPIDDENISCDSWLFLNGTANPDQIPVLSSSEIIFKLSAYNMTSQDVTEYDNSLLPIVNLTISSNGETDKEIANPGESITYTATAAGKYRVTAQIEDAECTIEGDSLKLNPNLSMEDQETVYNGTTAISLKYNETATGTINITLKGKDKEYNFTDVDLDTEILLGDIDSDEYEVIANYSGDDYFLNATATGTLTVKQADSSVNAEDVNITYGEAISIAVKSENATNVTYTILDKDGASVKTGTVDANGTITGLDLAAGEYAVNLTTVTDKNHKENTNSSKLTISKASSTISAEDATAIYGETAEIKVTSENASDISYQIKDKNNISVLNGTIKSNENIIVNDLDAGEYTAEIAFAGDENYTASNASAKISIKEADSSVNAEDVNVTYGEAINILVESENTTEISYEILDKDGKAVESGSIGANGTITVANLTAGEYTVNLTTIVDKNHNPSAFSSKLTIDKASSAISAEDANISFGETAEIKVTSENASEMSYQIKDKNNNIISNGTIKSNENIIVKDLAGGEYTAEIAFAGDENYTSSNATAKVTVNKVDTSINASDVNITYKEEDYLVATLIDSDGNPISGAELVAELDGNKTYTTDSNGQIKVPLKDVAAGSYNATISFAGNENYTESQANAKVVINRINTRFNFKNMTTTAFSLTLEGRIGKYFNFQLLDEYGNPLAGKKVSIGFHDKVYNRTSNATGWARLQINLACAGVYTFAVTFGGDDEYAGSFDVAAINVTLQTPKLTTSSKTYKASAKAKKLTASLKSFKSTPIPNKKITFTVNGKKYTGKTNKKGVATVNVSLSKKGTYKFTVQYAGDQTYKKVSKTGKITIK